MTIRTSPNPGALRAAASLLLFRWNRLVSDHGSSSHSLPIVTLLCVCLCALAEPTRVGGLEVRVLGPGGLTGSAEAVSGPDFTRTHTWFATSNGVIRLSTETLRVELACQEELHLPPNAGQEYSIAARDEQSAFAGTSQGGLFRVDFGPSGPRCQRLHADSIKGVFSLVYRPGRLLIGAEDGLWQLTEPGGDLTPLWRLEKSVLNTVTDIERTDEGDVFAVSRGGETWIAQGKSPATTFRAPASVEQRTRSRLVFDPHRNLLFVLGVSEQAMRASLIPLDDYSSRQSVGTAVADVYHDEDRLLLFDQGVISLRWDTLKHRLVPAKEGIPESVIHGVCTGRQDGESGEVNNFWLIRGEEWVLKPDCLLRFTQGVNGRFDNRTPERFGLFQSNAPPWHYMAVDHHGGVWIVGSGAGSVSFVHFIDPELQLAYTEPRLGLLGAYLALKPFWELGKTSLVRGRRTVRLLDPSEFFARKRRSDGTWQEWNKARDIREYLFPNPVSYVTFQITLSSDPRAMETSCRPVTESVLVFGGSTSWLISIPLLGLLAFLFFPVNNLARRVVNSNWRYVFVVPFVFSWFDRGKRHLLKIYIKNIKSGGSGPSQFKASGFPVDEQVVQVHVETVENQGEAYQSLKEFVAIEGRSLKRRLGAWVPVPIDVDDIENLKDGREFIDTLVANNGDLSLRLVEKMFDQREFIFLVNPEPAPSVDQIEDLRGYFMAAKIFLVVSSPFEEFSVYRERAG